MNSVQIIGNISTDIDIKTTPSGKFVAAFNIAVNNPYKRDKTSFLPIEVWGVKAENTAEYCKKGSKVGIVGYIEVDQWERDGERKYKTKIVASDVEFLTPKSQEDTNTQQRQQTRNDSQQDPFKKDAHEIFDSELPF